MRKILAVHLVRHARGVRVPGHHVRDRLALSHEVVADDAGPDQIIGAQDLKRPGHLATLEIALLPHDVFQECNLAFADEQRQFTCLREVGLCGQEGECLEALVVITRHRRGAGGQQRATETIANAMDLAVRNDLADRVQRGHRTQRMIVLHAEVALVYSRILPGDHEDCEPLLEQIAHERVLGAEIEDVVLHDPGRHDQDGLGTHLC